MPFFLSLLAGYAGALLLLASTACHWFGVPGARHEHSGVVIITLEPLATLFYKGAGLAVLAAVGVCRFHFRRAVPPAVLLSALFTLLLFYPYFVLTWTPQLAARASWLNTQHENLSWLGGDIFNEQEYKDIGWKSQIYVVDTERQVGVFRLPNWSPYMVQWGRLADLLEWLGYSNRFCQFVCKGWFAALAGVLLLLVSACRGQAGLRYPVARAVGMVGLVTAGGGLVLALIPPMLSGFLMMEARHAVQRGDPATALRWLERSAFVLPAIRQDTYFVAQKGLLERGLGRDTVDARLSVAQLFDRQGFAAQARARYEALVEQAPEDMPVQREAVRGILRMGLNELNSGSSAQAIETLQYVLEREPCNLKALYVLQLAALRERRFDLVREAANRLIIIYARFDTLTKEPVLAACNENLAAAAYLQGRLQEALAFHNAAIGRPQP